MKKNSDALSSINHYCLSLKHMVCKDTAYHINNFDPGHACWRQHLVKNMKITFICPLLKHKPEGKREQEAGNNVSVCVLNLLLEVSILPSLVTISPVRVKIQNFSNYSVINQDHLIKGHVTIWIEAHQGKPTIYQIWWP